jgi:hypothetical protein
LRLILHLILAGDLRAPLATVNAYALNVALKACLLMELSIYLDSIIMEGLCYSFGAGSGSALDNAILNSRIHKRMNELLNALTGILAPLRFEIKPLGLINILLNSAENIVDILIAVMQQV